ncbi:hypothetical protein BST27_14895 [Mycobacterium intermedium]|uniref:PE domain-containing protein n=1 Tax=Mycobacterium intermedium TaxID=28445 RepID=A0A1E3SA86_MYCIE|nr:hypothetical protein [Mycobacterium intermedium]MCV6967544.1 hypothetical protein [Mycobacterium intermedium]ODQ99066.1 hypothetical protein BHQ20_18995 [Mycobacterium intermedium]OPE52795.1 hypothetical protein BV508_00730 [Mycobacterium intermedium]ORB04154.1 hypothetical protein BST27_14895 [Mycobacterium intermedium]
MTEWGGLRLSVDELRIMASRWAGLSAERYMWAQPESGPSCQPTTAAVAAINTAIGTADAALTARAHDTAAAVVTSAFSYSDNDDAAAAAVALVRQTVSV